MCRLYKRSRRNYCNQERKPVICETFGEDITLPIQKDALCWMNFLHNIGQNIFVVLAIIFLHSIKNDTTTNNITAFKPRWRKWKQGNSQSPIISYRSLWIWRWWRILWIVHANIGWWRYFLFFLFVLLLFRFINETNWKSFEIWSDGLLVVVIWWWTYRREPEHPEITHQSSIIAVTYYKATTRSMLKSIRAYQ
jgi:hypothetical protein